MSMRNINRTRVILRVLLCAALAVLALCPFGAPARAEVRDTDFPALMRSADDVGKNSINQTEIDELSGKPVLGHPNICRRDILSVNFRPSLSGAPSDAWDVSEKRDGRVLAWVTPRGSLYDLTIAGDGGVKLLDPDGKSTLFAAYTSAETIDFNGCVDFSERTDLSDMFALCKNLKSVDLYGVCTSSVTNMDSMFYYCTSLTYLDVSGFDTSNVTTMWTTFDDCHSLEWLDVSGFDTSNVTNLWATFYGCKSLTALDVSGFDTRRVTNMKALFNGCEALTELDVSGFDVSNVKDMRWMFEDCTSLRTIGCNPDTFGHGDTTDMFKNCNALEPYEPAAGTGTVQGADFPVLMRDEMDMERISYNDVLPIIETPAFGHSTALRKDIASITFYPSLQDAPGSAWDVSENRDGSVLAWLTPNGEMYDLSIAGEGGVKIQDPRRESGLFVGYSNLESVSFNGCVDLSERKNFRNFFGYCGKLRKVDLKGVSTASATCMACMFYRCGSLEALDVSGFDTSNVTTMGSMFQDCEALEALDVSGFDTSKVTNMRFMFYGCKRLEALDVSGFDLSGVSSMSDMFSGCAALRSIGCDPASFGNGDTERMYDGCDALSAGGTPAAAPAPALRSTDLPVLIGNSDGFGTMMSSDDRGSYAQKKIFNHPSVCRGDIASITFYPTLRDAPADAWDISEAQDGRILAWLTPNGSLYDLSIAGDGGVKLADHNNDSAIFACYINAESIDFNGCVDFSELEDMSYLFGCDVALKRINMAGVSTPDATDMKHMFWYCSTLENLDVSGLDTSNVTNMEYMFCRCDMLKALDVSGFDTSKVTTMQGMFSHCEAVEALDVSGFDTSKVSTMKYMFCECHALRTIGCNPQTFGRGNIEEMFRGCNALGSEAPAAPAAGTAKSDGLPVLIGNSDGFGTMMSSDDRGSYAKKKIFNHPSVCRGDIASITFYPTLRDAPADAWDISEAQDGRILAWLTPNGSLYDLSIAGDGGVKLADHSNDSAIFACYINAESIDFNGCVDFSELKDMSYLFGCDVALKRINMAGVSTPDATDMKHMFWYCSTLENLDVSGLDTSNVTNMEYMFCRCDMLKALDVSGFDTSKVTTMQGMFSHCEAVEALDVSGFDTSKVSTMKYMFCECHALRTIGCNPQTFGRGNTEEMYRGCNALGYEAPAAPAAHSGDSSAPAAHSEAPAAPAVPSGASVRNTDFPVLMREEMSQEKINYAAYEPIPGTPVLGHPTVCRRDIATVTFYPSLSGAPSDAWDVSENRDGSVLAWLTPSGSLYDLSIAGDGGVKIQDPQKESGFFVGYSNLTSVSFNGCVDLSERRNMRNFFGYCDKLRTVDFSGVCTASATSMACMFYKCSSLEAADVSGFDTSNVTTMAGMFQECASLERLDVSGFDTSRVSSMSWMFYGCTSLKSIGCDPKTFGRGATDFMLEGCDALEPFGGSATPATPAGGLVRNTDFPVLMREEMSQEKINYAAYEPIPGTPVLGHPTVCRRDIATVTFYPSLSGAPSDAWDVSENRDGSVLAWLTPSGSLYDLSIAGEGGVKIQDPHRYSGLFVGFCNMESVSFNGCVDFSERQNLRNLFGYCRKLKRVDMTGVCTASATNMACMFYECQSLEAVDVSGFDTSHVTDMGSMFQECITLETLDLSGFDNSRVSNMGFMFYGDKRLKSIGRDAASFVRGANTNTFAGCSLLDGV